VTDRLAITWQPWSLAYDHAVRRQMQQAQRYLPGKNDNRRKCVAFDLPTLFIYASSVSIKPCAPEGSVQVLTTLSPTECNSVLQADSHPFSRRQQYHHHPVHCHREPQCTFVWDHHLIDQDLAVAFGHYGMRFRRILGISSSV